jgi:hypothetical protein
LQTPFSNAAALHAPRAIEKGYLALGQGGMIGRPDLLSQRPRVNVGGGEPKKLPRSDLKDSSDQTPI